MDMWRYRTQDETPKNQSEDLWSKRSGYDKQLKRQVSDNWRYKDETGSYVLDYEYVEGDEKEDEPSEPSIEETAVQEEAEQEFKAKEFIIEGRGDVTRPNPSLRAGEPIVLENLGDNFSGTYMPVSVEHTINIDSGYSQSFNVERNAVGMNVSSEEPPSNANVTREPAEEVDVQVE